VIAAESLEERKYWKRVGGKLLSFARDVTCRDNLDRWQIPLGVFIARYPSCSDENVLSATVDAVDFHYLDVRHEALLYGVYKL